MGLLEGVGLGLLVTLDRRRACWVLIIESYFISLYHFAPLHYLAWLLKYLRISLPWPLQERVLPLTILHRRINLWRLLKLRIWSLPRNQLGLRNLLPLRYGRRPCKPLVHCLAPARRATSSKPLLSFLLPHEIPFALGLHLRLSQLVVLGLWLLVILLGNLLAVLLQHFFEV